MARKNPPAKTGQTAKRQSKPSVSSNRSASRQAGYGFPMPFKCLPRKKSRYEETLRALLVAERDAFWDAIESRRPPTAAPVPYAPGDCRHVEETTQALPSMRFAERTGRVACALTAAVIEKKTAPARQGVIDALVETRVSANGCRLTFTEAERLAVRAAGRATREEIGEALAAYVERRLNAPLAHLNRERLKTLARLGCENERAWFEKRSGFGLQRLLDAATQVVVATDAAGYLEIMRSAVAERLNCAFPGLSQAHEARFLADDDLDRHFPKGRPHAACTATFAALGLDFTGLLNVELLDAAPETPAFCVSFDAPREIRLFNSVAASGLDACERALAATARAWHLATTESRWPYEWRNLRRTNAVADGLANLFASLTRDATWLAEVAGLTAEAAGKVAARRRLADLYRLRKELARLLYAAEFDRHPLDNWKNAFLFRSTMTRLTGFETPAERYLLDRPEGFSSADYLLTRLTEAHLRRHLVRTFGARWYCIPAAADFLKSLWAKGESLSCEELIAEIGDDLWDIRPLVEGY